MSQDRSKQFPYDIIPRDVKGLSDLVGSQAPLNVFNINPEMNKVGDIDTKAASARRMEDVRAFLKFAAGIGDEEKSTYEIGKYIYLVKAVIDYTVASIESGKKSGRREDDIFDDIFRDLGSMPNEYCSVILTALDQSKKSGVLEDSYFNGYHDIFSFARQNDQQVPDRLKPLVETLNKALAAGKGKPLVDKKSCTEILKVLSSDVSSMHYVKRALDSGKDQHFSKTLERACKKVVRSAEVLAGKASESNSSKNSSYWRELMARAATSLGGYRHSS